MRKSDSFIFFMLFIVLPCTAQKITLPAVLDDISNSRIFRSENEPGNFFARSTVNDFDSYVYNATNSSSDTIRTIGLLKHERISGAMIACETCASYSSLTITSSNPLLPSLSQSSKHNGVIDRAKYKTRNNRIMSVGDINNDKIIDYASYQLVDGLYGICYFKTSFQNPTSFQVYDALQKDYIGVLFFKTVGDQRIFEKCFVKAGQHWDEYLFSAKEPSFVRSIQDVNSLQKKIPDNVEFNQDTTHMTKRNENKIHFIRLMTRAYGDILKDWLIDHEMVIQSKAIGAKFPRLIIFKN